MTAPGFQPPTYPFDRLAPLAAAAEAHEGGMVDLSIGTPTDAPPPRVIAALADSGPSGATRRRSARCASGRRRPAG